MVGILTILLLSLLTCIGSDPRPFTFSDQAFLQAALPQSYSQTVLNLGPIAYWRLNDTSGTTAVNSEGTTARNATYHTNVILNWSTTGDFTLPLFNTNGYVDVVTTSLQSAFNGSEGSIVVHAVADPRSMLSTAFRRIEILRSDNNNRAAVYRHNTASNRFTWLYIAGGTSEALDAYLVPDNAMVRPNQFAVTWSKSNDRATYYFNGTPVITNTTLGNFTGTLTNSYIGNDQTTNNLPWWGSIFESSLFDKELTASQVASLFIGTPYTNLVRVGSLLSIGETRKRIVDKLWPNGMPSHGASWLSNNVTDPLAAFSLSPTNLSRVDDLYFVLTNDSGTSIYTNMTHVWFPTNAYTKLVIQSVGHSTGDGEYTNGLKGLLVKYLVELGMAVASVPIYLGSADSGTTVANHNAIGEPIGTNALRYFVEPSIRIVNHYSPSISTFYATGTSGGGWMTTLSAAIDRRISISAPVAGSMPLYVRVTGTGPRDWEQYLPGLYTFIDYTDLYVLAADAAGRAQQQMLNTEDPSVFSQANYNAGTGYTNEVQAVTSAYGGTWSLLWIANTTHSMITNTVNSICSLFNP